MKWTNFPGIRRRARKTDSFRFRMVLFMAAVMAVSAILAGGIVALIGQFHIWRKSSLALLVLATLVACLLFGTVLAIVFSRWFLRPVKEVILAMREISNGNYSVRVRKPAPEDHSEMSDLQRSFNEMAAELGGTELFRNDFINNFSHEFKTPISSIRGFARQLQIGGLSDEEEREYLSIIVGESDRLTRMSAGILQLCKLENQQIVSNRVRFSLDEQLRRAVLMLEKEWSEKELTVLPELEEPVDYDFDEEMLMQIWLNLLNNAIRYTPAGGQIGVTLQKKETFCEVCVWDTGIGMSEDVQKHIFEKFYQGDRSHHGEGNGIGLTTVSRVLELCGGEIEVDSKPGEGSRFTVRLPMS